mgnify:CR=1
QNVGRQFTSRAIAVPWLWAWRTAESRAEADIGAASGSVPINNHWAWGGQPAQSLVRETRPFIPSKALKLPFSIPRTAHQHDSTWTLAIFLQLRGLETALSKQPGKSLANGVLP